MHKQTTLACHQTCHKGTLNNLLVYFNHWMVTTPFPSNLSHFQNRSPLHKNLSSSFFCLQDCYPKIHNLQVEGFEVPLQVVCNLNVTLFIMWILCDSFVIILSDLSAFESSIYRFDCSMVNHRTINITNYYSWLNNEELTRLWFVKMGQKVMLCLMLQSTQWIMGLEFFMKLGIKSNHSLVMFSWL